MAIYYPPINHNSVVNSIFNLTDYITSRNDQKYVKLTGSSMTGGWSAVGLTFTGGTNNFMSNITLPTTYNSVPNASFPTINQVGGSNGVTYIPTAAAGGTLTLIATITLNPGIYLLNYRAGMLCTTGTGTVTSFVMGLSTTLGSMNLPVTRIIELSSHSSNSASIFTNELGDIGNCNIAITSTMSIYLYHYVSFSGTIEANDYITAIRIG